MEIPIFAPEKEGLYYLTFQFVYGAHLQKWFGDQVTIILKVFMPQFPSDSVIGSSSQQFFSLLRQDVNEDNRVEPEKEVSVEEEKQPGDLKSGRSMPEAQ